MYKNDRKWKSSAGGTRIHVRINKRRLELYEFDERKWERNSSEVVMHAMTN